MNTIIHVNHYGCHRGGVENYIREIAREMAEYQHHLLYAEGERGDSYLEAFARAYPALSSGEGEIERILTAAAPRHVIVYNTPGLSLAALLKLRPRLGFKITKSIHDYGMFYAGTGYNRVTLRRSRDPMGIFSLSGCLTRNAFTRKFEFVNIWHKKRLLAELNEVDAIEIHTEDMRKTLARNGVAAARIYLNPPWAREPERRGTGPKAGSILFVGNLIRGKGLQLLIKALRSVESDWELTVVGHGYQRPRLEKYVRRYRMPVRFAGHVPKAEIGRFYEESALVVFPSVFEPFGFVLLEAMSHRRPVIAFATGGPAEIIADGVTGFLIEPFDLRAMAAKIDHLLRHPDVVSKMGDASYDTFVNKYTFHRHLEKLRGELSALEGPWANTR